MKLFNYTFFQYYLHTKYEWRNSEKKFKFFFSAQNQHFLDIYLNYFIKFFENENALKTFLKFNWWKIFKFWLYFMIFVFVSFRFIEIFYSICYKICQNVSKTIKFSNFLDHLNFEFLKNFIKTKMHLFAVNAKNMKEYFFFIKTYGFKIFLFSYI